LVEVDDGRHVNQRADGSFLKFCTILIPFQVNEQARAVVPGSHEILRGLIRRAGDRDMTAATVVSCHRHLA
jgi:hypothetical protein